MGTILDKGAADSTPLLVSRIEPKGSVTPMGKGRMAGRGATNWEKKYARVFTRPQTTAVSGVLRWIACSYFFVQILLPHT
jgi:hypothetical protein